MFLPQVAPEPLEPSHLEQGFRGVVKLETETLGIK